MQRYGTGASSPAAGKPLGQRVARPRYHAYVGTDGDFAKCSRMPPLQRQDTKRVLAYSLPGRPSLSRSETCADKTAEGVFSMKRSLVVIASSLALAIFFAQIASSSTTSDSPATKHLEQSPQAVLQALMSAFNRHDFAALDKLVASEGVYEDFAARFRGVGPAQVKNFLRGVIQVEPDFNWQLTNAIESGSSVAAEWTWTATHTGDGPGGKHFAAQRVSGRGATVAVIENGQIKQLHDYYDDASFYPMARSTGQP